MPVRDRDDRRERRRFGPLAISQEEFERRRREWLERRRAALPRLTRAYFSIAVGCLVMAAGFSFFMIPQRIAPGGVFGIATVLHYASRSLLGIDLPTGAIGLVLNIPLFVWGLRSLGGRFVSRTVFGMVAASLFMDLLSYWIVRSGWEAAVAEADPMLAAVFGGLAIGVGLGITFRHMGSTGGTDVVGQILGRKSNISVGVWMMIVDAAIVVAASSYFRDLNLSLYAVITIFVTGKVIDQVLAGRSYSRSVTIITEKGEAIREAIVFGIDRTGTILEGRGLYRGRRKDVVICVVNRKNLVHLERLVAAADPEAFLIVSEAYEVLGEGFKPLEDRLAGQAPAV
ncbi:MAG: YitT family protein [Candidatus Latescibacterota bacterium]|nr:MAG: YitT family protein [Candidatus Latescibacterota bacterium]